MSPRARVALALGVLVLVALVCLGTLDVERAGPTERMSTVFEKLEEVPAVPVAEGHAREAAAPSDMDDAVRVECELWRPFDFMASMRLEEVDPETLEPVAVHELHTDDQFIDFLPRHPVGLGRIYITSHEPAVISWAQGACLDLVELTALPTVLLTGRVTGVLETGAVSVHIGCGEDQFYRAPQPPNGRFSVELPQGAEHCVLVPRRVFGGRDLEGLPTTIVPTDDVIGIELMLPSAPGVGLGLYEVSAGLRVAGVEPGTPAARAGLELMDTVVLVDGEPAADLVAVELIYETGPLRLEVMRDGKTFEVVVEAIQDGAP